MDDAAPAPLEDPTLAPALDWVGDVCGPVVSASRLRGGMTSTMLALDVGRGDRGPERVVLRLMTEEPWRTHGAGLVTRESDVLRMLDGSGLPVPRSLALDADGAACGHPAHLSTRLPGAVDPDRVDAGSLDRLAALLAAVHAVTPTVPVRGYQSWAWEAKHVTPAWAREPAAWEEAFALLRRPAPAHVPTFLHRDFSPRNVLWDGGPAQPVAGLVDWVETSVGPAWLDVAHAATNLALRHGDAVADAFADAYRDRTGSVPQPYFDVMDVVGFLPPPGREPFSFAAAGHDRLEGRLVTVLGRLGAG